MKIKTFIALILTILSCSVLKAQNQLPVNNYEKEWKIADDFIQKSQPKSALDVVIVINNRARKDANYPQLIKSILYKIRLQADFEEDFMLKNIAEIETEAKKAVFPAKPVLQSILAELYFRYYQSNRYEILQRSITANFKQKDLATWDARKFFEVIIENYLASLKDVNQLKAKPIGEFDIIIEKGNNGRIYRPTLYDFLAFRAIDFLMNTESGLTRPADDFQLNEAVYFAPALAFSNMKISTKNNLSLDYYCLKLLQDVTTFHLKDSEPDALLDVEIERLDFVKNKSILENKNKLYTEALEKLKSKYAAYEKSAEIDYLLAENYNQQGNQYNPVAGDKNRWDKKKALEFCENAIKNFPKSYYGLKCKNLINEIKKTSLSLKIDNAILPNEQSLSLVTYKNISKLYFRLIKLEYDADKKIRQNSGEKKIINEYLKLTPVYGFEKQLTDAGDYQDHKTEIGIPAIANTGYYVLLASTDKNFSCDENIVTYNNFWVTEISYVSRRIDGNVNFYLLNRKTGYSLANARIKAYKSEYNYQKREYETKFWKEFGSNSEGFFEIIASNSRGDYNNISLEFYYNNDKFISDGYSIYGYEKQPPQKVLNTFFFTDRAIYRPGQTVFFKGIILETEGKIKNIKANHPTTVNFFDVNGQKVSDLKLTSNEYGSVSGSFTAPSSGLTGQMRIGNEWGNIYFSVEEYKRPKFEVGFNPLKGSYKLNEKITVVGFAKAYAGNNIDNANVKFRIVRTARFPYWGWWMKSFYSSSPELEVTNGSCKTNEKGEFSIDFTAFPDLSIDKSLNPVFNYEITADVTDLNGETHSSTQTISVAYNALIVDVDINEKINLEEKHLFKINTTNQSGNPEKADGNIKIYQLKMPDRVFRDRKWENPDVFSMSKEEFYKNFPLDVYNNENEVIQWEKGREVLNLNFATPQDTFLVLKDLKKWQQGVYLMEIKSKDIYGTALEVKKYFTVYSPDEKQIPLNEVAWLQMIKSSGEPGETASFLFGSKEKDLNVLYEIEVDGQITSKQWLKISNEQKLFKIPITEAQRGNFTIHLILFKNNRSYTFNETVIVPFTNKKLDISFESFRNKLLPGQKEEWKIRIRGSKGEKLAAELLASMYDASLDAFKTSSWDFNIFSPNYSRLQWESNAGFDTDNSNLCYYTKDRISYPKAVTYDRLKWFGYNNYGYYGYRGAYKGSRELEVINEDDNIQFEYLDEAPMAGVANLQDVTISKNGGDKKEKSTYMWADSVVANNPDDEKGKQQSTDFSDVKARSNFNETAFFYPQLTTNDSGDVLISFTIPEALTKWKMRGLAYTKDLKIGQIQKELVTQKDLMVVPNAPRFFREGDNMAFQVKVSNISNKELSGIIRLQFFNALTMQPIMNMLLENTDKDFTVKAGESQNMAWSITIPEGLGAVTYKVVAKAGDYSDGEEMAIPVLTNRMLVTETLPLPINGRQSKDFRFEKLINSASSGTLKHQKLTLEFTSNPAWYAVQALPYIMEYPFECAEQVFSRFYANSLAGFIANSNPKIRKVFDNWKYISTDALLSNLEKNQELKNILLEETPWLLNAKDESERKKRIGLLFDMNKMASELGAAKQKILKNQLPNGAWAWFPGGVDDRYITQHIVTGFAHLQHLGVNAYKGDYQMNNMVQKAVYYLDERIREDYEYIRKHYPKDLSKDQIGSIQIQYLYARSYFTNEIPLNPKSKDAFEYFKAQAQKFWTTESKYMQGMMALALKRFNDQKTPADIMKSLKENALYSEEMGMYWRDLSQGYYWYQSPIETMALLIEAFDEVSNDRESVEKMKIWLLKQKQTQDWKTTKATSEAIYALLLRGTDLLASDRLVEVSVGGQKINPYQSQKIPEGGTGYFKTSWNTNEIKPEMGNINVIKTDDGVAWGAMYWQYFEQLDKITPAATPLKLDKKLFVERNTSTGPVIEPIGEIAQLKVGDKVKVRIELRVDRDMEYVHLKDMRASAFEPVNVLSGYRWQQGMGYYESTRDAATNFFISYLGKGTYVFEYNLTATQKGNFSNGITSIQCMYAPEFSSHSEGIRIKVE